MFRKINERIEDKLLSIARKGGHTKKRKKSITQSKLFLRLFPLPICSFSWFFLPVESFPNSIFLLPYRSLSPFCFFVFLFSFFFFFFFFSRSFAHCVFAGPGYAHSTSLLTKRATPPSVCVCVIKSPNTHFLYFSQDTRSPFYLQLLIFHFQFFIFAPFPSITTGPDYFSALNSTQIHTTSPCPVRTACTNTLTE